MSYESEQKVFKAIRRQGRPTFRNELAKKKINWLISLNREDMELELLGMFVKGVKGYEDMNDQELIREGSDERLDIPG